MAFVLLRDPPLQLSYFLSKLSITLLEFIHIDPAQRFPFRREKNSQNSNFVFFLLEKRSAADGLITGPPELEVVVVVMVGNDVGGGSSNDPPFVALPTPQFLSFLSAKHLEMEFNISARHLKIEFKSRPDI
jgi:hypothetical protein